MDSNFEPDAKRIKYNDNDANDVNNVMIVDENNCNTCSICIEHILESDKMNTSCNHIFHKECLEKWLKINNQCPYCRTMQYKTNTDNPYNLTFNHPVSQIAAFAQSYNFLRIMSGMGGLEYSS